MAQLKALVLPSPSIASSECANSPSRKASSKIKPRCRSKSVAVDGVFVPSKRARYLDRSLIFRLRIRAVLPEAARLLCLYPRSR